MVEKLQNEEDKIIISKKTISADPIPKDYYF